MYLERRAEALLRSYLSLFPCVVLTGPRQSGKSTLVRHVLPRVSYVTFDDPEEGLNFRLDPQGFLGRFEGTVILDEVQRVPELFRYLKMAIDAQPQAYGRFVVTGSNQLTLQKNVSESLAGRAGYLSLLPLETRELPLELRPAQILTGSYPGLAVRNFEGLRPWFASYLATYLERDIRVVFDIGKLSDFQVLVGLVAARVSQEQNAAILAREIGVSGHTVDSWISALHVSYLTFPLRPFSANLGKRLIKRPKLYFWDNGLVCHLTGIRDQETLEAGPLAGPLFENLVVAEIHKQAAHAGEDKEFWFYRDNTGNEIDLITQDHAKRLVTLTEIKSGFTAKADWVARLERAASLVRPEFERQGYRVTLQVIYRGESKLAWPKLGIDFVNFQATLPAS